MQGTPEQLQHFEDIVEAIHAELEGLALKYDTRLLTTMLMDRASRQLRSLVNAGIYSADVAESMVAIAFADVTDKLPSDQMPKMVSMGGSTTVN